MRIETMEKVGKIFSRREMHGRGWRRFGLFWLLGVILGVLPNSTTADTSNGIICGGVAVRNRVENFAKLENCSVIEGSLSIMLLNLNESSLANVTFPKLREVTGYVLFFRATGIASLGKLFPNLAVIRGNELMDKYALIIYEMTSLQEVGLYSLTNILRGSVIIEKNPNLCHMNTIDWDQIAKEGIGDARIVGNRHYGECPNKCPDRCPTHPKFGSGQPGGAASKLCWNSHVCQKVCKPECERRNATCDSTGQCCDPRCLGGCSENSTSSCIACANYRFDDKCVNVCPTNTFSLNGRRCVYESYCNNYKRRGSPAYKSHQGTCVESCPSGYIEDSANPSKCSKCSYKCPKVCKAQKVDSISSANSLIDCTYINGSLVIEVTSGRNVMKEMERSLSAIEEVSDYIRVTRSSPLISLSFLKSLHTIHGKLLYRESHAFVVHDNNNLQEIWDWKHRTQKKFTILNGGLYFHLNPKLCYDKIEGLKNHSSIANMTHGEMEISTTTNGDRVPCNVKTIGLNITVADSKGVFINWDSMDNGDMDDHRNLLGYLIYYKKIKKGETVNQFDGRDACGGDQWKVVDIDAREMPNNHHHLTSLEPYTNYAIYVKSNVITTSRQGAQSPIRYFQTLMDAPSQPQNVRAEAPTDNQLAVRWEPPKNPNGEVKDYRIIGVLIDKPPAYIGERDYCADPLVISPRKPDSSGAKNKTMESVCPECNCASDGSGDSVVERQDSIAFEDRIHNAVFKKNYGTNRQRKRRSDGRGPKSSLIEIDNHISTTSTSDEATTDGVILGALGEPGSKLQDGLVAQMEIGDYPKLPSTDDVQPSSFVCENVLDNVTQHLISFCEWVDTSSAYHVTRLRHFSEYQIKIIACTNQNQLSPTANCDTVVYKNRDKMCCSFDSIDAVRTQMLAGADDIDSSSLQVNAENTTDTSGQTGILVKWSPPPRPNGMLVAYQVEYKAMDVENAKPIQICVNYTEYNVVGGRILHSLNAGKYSFRVRATSLAGYGNWTVPKIHTVVEVAGRQKYLSLIIIFTVLAILTVFAAVFGGVYYAKKKMSKQIPDAVLYASINPEYLSSSYEPDEWEVERDKIKLIHELGQGSFGMVYEGIVFDLSDVPETQCAVKTVNEGASVHERIEFLQEASVMKRFDAFHVVKLLGVVSKGQPVYVIMELMSNGDLKSYLRSHRPDQDEAPKGDPPTLKQVLQMAAEIADGMAYLASLKFVHRDLAARNCMVAIDLTVKIGDFGMTRDIYETDYYRKGGKGLLPVRWMSPESLRDGVFTAQGDVWSYGVVLWEMVTLATMPYQGLSNEQVLKWVIGRHIMEKPENCPEKLYEIMKQCWEYTPKQRPMFTDIVEMLLEDTHDTFRQIAYYITKARPHLKEESQEERPGTSGEGTPLVLQPSHKVVLSSLRENRSTNNTTDLVTDVDEESNLYISDDVISDNDAADDSGGENWGYPPRKRESASLTRNSDYGSGRSPTVQLLMPSPSGNQGGVRGGVSPPNGDQAPPTIREPLLPQIVSPTLRANPAASEPSKGSKVTSNGSIQSNGRVYYPLNNRTTAC